MAVRTYDRLCGTCYLFVLAVLVLFMFSFLVLSFPTDSSRLAGSSLFNVPLMIQTERICAVRRSLGAEYLNGTYMFVFFGHCTSQADLEGWQAKF